MDSKADYFPAQTQRRAPPPLPPRQPSASTTAAPLSNVDAPPAYESIMTHDMTADNDWTSQDPRSSSTQSLIPADSNQQNERRKLLCVYIHGFMGDTTSFRSFPAHVHNLLTVLLAETHVVHSKLYPQYRSKRNISFARDDFSKWLEPHESSTTDVVLLGHSMGGLLAAEVVLKPPEPPARRALKHRILGTINFDVPYLGMHPGVVKSGLASIFSAPEEPHDQFSPGIEGPQAPARADTLWTPSNPDPNYNPNFQNDVVLPVRKGWRNAWHFVNKHSGDLTKATKSLVTSHLEFGGAMANYGELKGRYSRVRALEEDSGDVRRSIVNSDETPPRVRFINYYTASIGRPKEPKTPERRPSDQKSEGKASLEVPPVLDGQAVDRALEADGVKARALSRSPSPRISVEEHRDDHVVHKEPDIPSDDEISNMNEMQHLDAVPVSDSEAYSDREDWEEAAESLSINDREEQKDSQPITHSPETSSIAEPATPSGSTMTPARSLSLPSIPDPPNAPPPLDVSYITDKDTRKLVEKEHARAIKSYEKAIKDREKAITDRAKLEQKLATKTRKDSQKLEKDALKAKEKAKLDKRKQADKEWKLERRETEKQMSQQEHEMLRLENERRRMEREARRMRGDRSPERQPSPPPDSSPGPSTAAPTPVTDLSRASTMPGPSRTTTQDSSRSRAKDKEKEEDKGPPKDRMFCTLPPKDSAGQRDPAWVRIFMKDVDEVGAHCGLFFVDERYERMVGDVAERIEGWVGDSLGERAAKGWDGEGLGAAGGKRAM